MSMIHDITSQNPRYKRGLRKGRGESSGHGKTSGRGTKGAGARSGGPHWKPGHEGGQTPLHRRLPTRGFSNDRWANNWHVVNVVELQAQFDDGATIDAAALLEKKLIPNAKFPVKILGNGDISKKFTVQVGWYSKSAYEKLTQAGGTAQNAKGQPFEFPKPKKKFVPREVKKDKAKAEQAAAPAEQPKA